VGEGSGDLAREGRGRKKGLETEDRKAAARSSEKEVAVVEREEERTCYPRACRLEKTLHASSPGLYHTQGTKEGGDNGA